MFCLSLHASIIIISVSLKSTTSCDMSTRASLCTQHYHCTPYERTPDPPGLKVKLRSQLPRRPCQCVRLSARNIITARLLKEHQTLQGESVKIRVKLMLEDIVCSTNKSPEQRLNLSRSWHKGHSRAYNTSFFI
jgi:hypothetical protein